MVKSKPKEMDDLVFIVCVVINGDNMRKIMEVYDYVWSDETL